ncbi:MAG: hypothetical protein EBQ82_11860 [Betaproteobacteria bacterium]|nr:hypothetical protein [Betaproteobacteria bacterium]
MGFGVTAVGDGVMGHRIANMEDGTYSGSFALCKALPITWASPAAGRIWKRKKRRFEQVDCRALWVKFAQLGTILEQTPCAPASAQARRRALQHWALAAC